MSHNSFWNSCLENFKDQIAPQQYNSWLKPLLYEFKEEKIFLVAPNSFTLKIIQERFLQDILLKAQNHFQKPIQVELSVSKKTFSHEKLTSKPTTLASKPNISSTGYSSRLNSNLLFENFVTGKQNHLAHAAAIQVAGSPATTYNPLFIYGGVGLGKTHLIQAIGNRFKKENPQAKICYVHATNYITDVVKAFQTKQFDQFKQYYNSLDLLLIDDIQFIADKPGTQQEFFYTLNSLIDTSKQVVMTCDTFPKDISGIEPRLTSRFSSGLTVAIEPPSIEMRVAILLQKSSYSNISIGEDVAFFVAKHIRSNIRELEGALNRIEAFSKFHHRPITIDLAKDALKDLLAAQNKQVSIENIQKTVADFYRIKLFDLLSKKRTRVFARPRQIAMCLARELTQLSLPEIGSAFGGRDHSTVLHACKTIEHLKNTDPLLNNDFNLLNQTLRN